MGLISIPSYRSITYSKKPSDKEKHLYWTSNKHCVSGPQVTFMAPGSATLTGYTRSEVSGLLLVGRNREMF